MAYISFQPNDFFNTLLYTGDGSARSLTGVGFQPDFVWMKGRSFSDNHIVCDSARGVEKYLQPDTSAAEGTGPPAPNESVTSFDADGFSIGGWSAINTNTANQVAWNWKAGTTSGIATNGSTTITPTAYSFNQTCGFSVVKYTGNGTSGAKIAHGLGKTPTFVFVKRLGSSGSWDVVSRLMGATYYIRLDTDGAKATGTWAFNDTLPDSVNFTVGDNAETNSSDGNVAYCFAPINGYSAMGKFDGNGDTRGCFIQTGFKPAFVMIKRTNGTGPWMIYHDKVPGYNETNTYIQANATSAEDTNAGNFGMSMYATGFQPQSTSGATGPNQDGDDYVYLAFANKPIASSNSKAGTAR